MAPLYLVHEVYKLDRFSGIVMTGTIRYRDRKKEARSHRNSTSELNDAISSGQITGQVITSLHTI